MIRKKKEIYKASEYRTESTGTVRLNIKLENNNINQIKLRNILLVLEFKNNLLSVACTTTMAIVTFTKDYAEIQRKDETVAIKTKRQGNIIYIMNENQSIYANNTILCNSINVNDKQL